MQIFSRFVFFQVPLLLVHGGLSHSFPKCKSAPFASNWPSPRQWNDLNAELGGNLIRTVPPGAVCHPNEPSYNNKSCTLVQSQWTNSSFHSRNPISVDYNDDTCPPSTRSPCSELGYPVYVINASTAAHVQSGVNFARENNLRLVVKGTGHDFNGRCLAFSSDLSCSYHN